MYTVSANAGKHWGANFFHPDTSAFGHFSLLVTDPNAYNDRDLIKFVVMARVFR